MEHEVTHDDGRKCRLSRMTGKWYHWDHPEPEPGPREVVRYECDRPHVAVVPEPQYPDRGDFGMPTIGSMGISSEDIGVWTLGPGTVIAADEMRHYKYPTGPKQERVCNIMDEAQIIYKSKAAGYRGVEGDTADHLGAKGQFADINRKFWRLKAMLWDEVVPMYPDAGAGESVEEILMDFIGHAALTIDFLRESHGTKEESK